MTDAPAPADLRAAAPTGRFDAMAWAGWLSLAIAAAYVALLVIGRRQGAWLTFADGSPRTMDFTPFWDAGRLAAHGRPGAAYHWTQLRADLKQATGHLFVHPLPFRYPPVFLLIMTPLGLLPFMGAASLWLALSLAAYLAAAWAVLPRWTALAISLATPGVLYSVSVAQNGLLTAALLGGGLALLSRRPILAGALLGGLVYKPHFAILIPIALAAGGCWRATAAAAAAATGLLALSTAAFGPSIWVDFLQGSHEAGQLTAHLDVITWRKLQSVYAGLYVAGAPKAVAAGLQALGSVTAAAAVAALWRSRSPPELKAAGLLLATLLATPYAFPYDLPMLGSAALFLLRDGERKSWTLLEAALIVAGWAAPLLFFWIPFAVAPFACAISGSGLALRIVRDARAQRLSPLATR